MIKKKNHGNIDFEIMEYSNYDFIPIELFFCFKFKLNIDIIKLLFSIFQNIFNRSIIVISIYR